MDERQDDYELDVSWLKRCPKELLLEAAEYLLLRRSFGTDNAYWKLQFTGKLPRFAEQRLLEIASVPHVQQKLSEYGDSRGWDGYSLSSLTERAWDDLTRLRSKDFAKILRKCLKHENVAVKCEAAHRLANLAFDQDVRLLNSLARRDWRVATSVLFGFILARTKRPSKQFAKSMLSLARDISAGKLHDGPHRLSDAIRVVQEVDPTNADQFLLSRECLYGANPMLDCILLKYEFRRDDGEETPLIEPSLLWKVYDEVAERIRSGDSSNGGLDDELGLLLIEGVRADPARARQEIEKINKPSKGEAISMLHRRVAQARDMLKGVPNPQAVLAVAEKRMKKLSGTARSVLHAKRFGDDLYNDSLETYLEANTADCVSACEGLRLMGLSKYANTLKRCHAAYVAGGKLINLETFVSELPAALRRDVRTLERNGHAIINAALDYAEKHAKEFK
ncbi:MAG: hypothetical protein U0640_08405 [Phycisphaerales bacterium]